MDVEQSAELAWFVVVCMAAVVNVSSLLAPTPPILKETKGAADISVEQVTGLLVLRVAVDRDRAALGLCVAMRCDGIVFRRPRLGIVCRSTPRGTQTECRLQAPSTHMKNLACLP